jgi:hypothetical protein
MYARYASTAGWAFGSIVGVGLLVGAEVIRLDVEAVGFKAPSPPPQAVVDRTVRVAAAAAAIRFSLIKA